MPGRTRLWAGAVIMAALAGALLIYHSMRGSRGEGEINPNARIDPRKTYEIVLWETHWPVSPGGVPYSLWLAQTLERIGRRFPNVKVRVEWVQNGEMGDRLEKAVREGHPPDLAAVGPGALALYDRERQVPASLYMADEEMSVYAPASLAMLSLEGDAQTVWGWPRWLAFHGWLASPSREEKHKGPGRQGRWVPVSAAEALCDIMATAGHPVPLSSDGKLVWDQENLKKALNLISTKGRGRGKGSVFAGLLSGDVDYAMGISPWAAAKLSSRKDNWLNLVLPPLGDQVLGAGKPAVRGSGGAVLMFRRDGKGSDHLRAAAEVARYLSREGFPWASGNGPVVAAVVGRDVSDTKGRSRNIAVRVQHGEPAASALKGLVVPPFRSYDIVKSEKRYLSGKVAPVLDSLLHGKIGVEEAVRELTGGLEPADQDLSSLEREITQYIKNYGGIYGIYLQDLSTGQEWGLNAEGVFLAASTIKLPLVLYLYEQAIRGLIDLDEKVKLEQEDMFGGTGFLQDEGPGTVWTLRELAEAALQVSDNVAANALFRRLGRDNVYDYMRGLGAGVVPTGIASGNVTSPRDMGLYLRRLLELRRQDPVLVEDVITALSNTPYKDRLVARLPENIVVAHKVGAIAGSVSDAGIVFLPGRPYILVLFAATRFPEETRDHLADLSFIVYRFMTR